MNVRRAATVNMIKLTRVRRIGLESDRTKTQLANYNFLSSV
jgi:hypothetical protein